MTLSEAIVEGARESLKNTDGYAYIVELGDTTLFFRKGKLFLIDDDDGKLVSFDDDAVITQINRSEKVPMYQEPKE